MNWIKVIIADDSDFVRDGMGIILDADPDFQVLGCVSNGQEAIRLALETPPDIFLWTSRCRLWTASRLPSTLQSISLAKC
nr:hypothetical protein [uncultured Blautia sp.]